MIVAFGAVQQAFLPIEMTALPITPPIVTIYITIDFL